MARALRSRANIQILEDDALAAAQVPLPATPTLGRPSLGEIHQNTIREAVTFEDFETDNKLKNLKAAYKSALGVKKNKKGKKGRKGQQSTAEETGSSEVVLEDPQPATVSVASNDAPRDLPVEKDIALSVVQTQQPHPPQAIQSPPKTAAKASAVGSVTNFTTLPPPAIPVFDPDFVDTVVPGQYNYSSYLPIHNTLCIPHAENLKGFPVTPSAPMSLDWYFSSFEKTRNPSKADTVELANEAAQSENLATGDTTNRDEDIIMSTPSPMKAPVVTLGAIEAAEQKTDLSPLNLEKTSDDSFVEQISLRTPAKPAPRIEDSVEEFDKIAEIEEALHEAHFVEQLLSTKANKGPTSKSRPISVTTGRDTDKQPSRKANPGMDTLRIKANGPAKKPVAHDRTGVATSTFTKSQTSIKQSAPVKKTVKRPASLLPPREPQRVSKAPTVSSFQLPGEAVALRLKEQREARQAQREAAANESKLLSGETSTLKIKSNKPITKPTFELPGEAVSRKKREAHEARLKAQDEEGKKRREFKARPLRKSIVPEVRETAASRARRSIIVSADLNLLATNDSAAIGAHRPSIRVLNNMANISASRAPGPASSRHTFTRKPSSDSGPSTNATAAVRIVSPTDTFLQRKRAKEIYSRDVKAQDDIDREKREREAAAKKSREEAAERGRQASKEWAEKQRAKKAAESMKALQGVKA